MQEREKTDAAIVRIGALTLAPTDPTRVMAILNVSPESFYAGSVHVGRQAVRDAAERAAENGADLLDLGAMSTAPYKETRIGRTEEADRMGEAVAAAREAAGLPITADTMHLEAARAALEAGADAINDVSGLEEDPALATLVAERGCPVILMAREPADGTPLAGTPTEIATQRLREALARAERVSIPRERIVLDPGIGFFRRQRVEWHAFDLELLRSLPRFASLGQPLLVSASRKSFLGKLLGREDPADRLAGSLAVATWCALQRVAIVRAHDVAETRDAIRVADLLQEKR